MTLSEVQNLLDTNRITYRREEYENEGVYSAHRVLFPYRPEQAAPCKVLVLVIPSRNGQKDLELQFNQSGEEFLFQDIFFGAYSFELFHRPEDELPAALMECITETMEGNVAFIMADSLKDKTHLWGGCYGLTDDDPLLGKAAYDAAVQSILAPHSLLGRLLSPKGEPKERYELYDWNSYQCVLK